MEGNKNGLEDGGQSFDLKKLVSSYTKHWKWFVISCFVFLTLAYVINRYEKPMYTATAKIMILDNDSNSGSNILKDISIMSSAEDAMVEDEIQVINSRSLLMNIVKKLEINIQFFSVGNIIEAEIYKNRPFTINFLASDSIISNTNAQFLIKVLSNKEFEYKANEDDVIKKYSFGDTIPNAFGGMIIVPNKDYDLVNIIDSDIRVSITAVDLLAEVLKQSISIFPSTKGSKVVDIYYENEKTSKAIDIINALIDEYNLSTLEKSKLRARNTSDFINERVESIALDLVSVEDSIVRYKSSNKITDISTTGGILSSSSLTSEQQLQELRIQLNMLNYMKKTLQSNTFENLPSNLGGSDPSIVALSSRYNELLEKRRVVLKSAGENNSVVIDLDQTLNSIKENLRVSVDNNINTLNIQLKGLQNQLSSINSKISTVPIQESKLMSIGRRQGIKESLYLYLLEKREEAEISQTTTLPNAKIIDRAYSLGPVKSKKSILFIGAMLIGLLFPFLIIYVSDLLDSKIHNKEDLDNLIKNIPILGEIPAVKDVENGLVKSNDRSVLSESFRIIRTNFEFVKRANKIKKNNNVFFVTSTINGEGKSFVSMNTALTSASSGNRVLLIGSDLRNPQIFTNIEDIGERPGLSEYLADDTILLNETISSHEINGISIDVLLSGRIPPNPAELLMGNRVKELFDIASEQYDVVIVDTAPSMLVTDTLLISQYAAYTIFVVRAGYTEKRILNFAKELHAEKKLNKMMIVVNDVKESNFGYGAKYGYYGAPEKKSFFSWKKKA
ncbi:tyrosine-protein kinase [uncultured Algibacter sp.]|uniref:GumC family protein n=1 Tax=uncultured Algibacter sp. TaxID=298659 RepID=UPI0026156F0B|nr:tyrosine-protein kinase [uncultured Algibacter sp.]